MASRGKRQREGGAGGDDSPPLLFVRTGEGRTGAATIPADPTIMMFPLPLPSTTESFVQWDKETEKAPKPPQRTATQYQPLIIGCVDLQRRRRGASHSPSVHSRHSTMSPTADARLGGAPSGTPARHPHDVSDASDDDCRTPPWNPYRSTLSKATTELRFSSDDDDDERDGTSER